MIHDFRTNRNLFLSLLSSVIRSEADSSKREAKKKMIESQLKESHRYIFYASFFTHSLIFALTSLSRLLTHLVNGLSLSPCTHPPCHGVHGGSMDIFPWRCPFDTLNKRGKEEEHVPHFHLLPLIFPPLFSILNQLCLRDAQWVTLSSFIMQLSPSSLSVLYCVCVCE